ncbi:MAG: hypothetical protein JEY91_00615 [Spirochaetaceae bacterium]|nr:hypothetical protein [Spirochaetaceae bacterium]
MSNYTIDLETRDNIAYYTVHWSPFIKLDKRIIRSLIPAEAGIFQLFNLKNGSLDLLSTHQAYYGGLRAIFLEILDEDCPISFPDKKKLRESKTYLRYSVSSSKDNLRDILHHFSGGENSERFLEIMVEESECMKVAH